MTAKSSSSPPAPSFVAKWVTPPPGESATGGRIASPLGQVSWAMFEFARVPFVLLITIYIYGPYFSRELVGDPVRGQALWGDIQGYSGVFIALLAPFLGAIADAGGRRKPWIAFYVAVIALATLLLWYGAPGGAGLPLLVVGILVACANVAFEFSSVFFNAMLPAIAPHKRIGALSGLGLALGNAGGVLLLVFMLVVLVLPGAVDWSFIPDTPWFGLDQAAHEPERFAGPLSAICILLFSVPLFLWTPDRPNARMKWLDASLMGIRSVIRTTKSLKHYRNVGTYLLARLFFNDGMTALLTFGGVYAAGIFGWGALDMVVYGIILSIFAVFGGFFGGWLDDFLGSKPAIFVSVGGTVLFGAFSLMMGPDRILWFIPYDPNLPPVHDLPFFKSWPELIYVGIVILIAICVTASYANARTMMARIAPTERMAEFFGLYSLSGQSTTFLATLSVGWLTMLTDSQRGGFIAIYVFLIAGLIGMIFVREERARSI